MIEDADAKNSIQIVPIKSRTVYVSTNNTWRNLGTAESSVRVEPDRSGICTGEHSVPLKKYIEDPLVALTVRVEFEAELPKKTERLIVAWDVYLP